MPILIYTDISTTGRYEPIISVNRYIGLALIESAAPRLSHLITNIYSPHSSLLWLTGRTDHSLFLCHLLLLRSKIKYKISSFSAKSNVLEKLALLPLVWAVGLWRSAQMVTMETTACTSDSVRHFI